MKICTDDHRSIEFARNFQAISKFAYFSVKGPGAMVFFLSR